LIRCVRLIVRVENSSRAWDIWKPTPVLDALAAKQVEDGTPFAVDAVMYLGRFGGAAVKPVVWEQLSRWHNEYVERGTKRRMATPPSKPDDWQLYNRNRRDLTEAAHFLQRRHPR
jgi:hypothetical protein